MTSLIKRFTLGLTILVMTIGLIGLCWNALATNGDQNPSQEETVQSEKERVTSPEVSLADLGMLVAGNTEFAFDLYRQLGTNGSNLFFSPYSISLALAMTYAGARSTTEEQMAETLHFTTLGQDRLHPAFNALVLELASRGEDPTVKKEDRFQLHIANALWGQDGYGFLPAFLDVLAENYGAELTQLDFIQQPEAARLTINDWVSDETDEKIKDLLPQGSIAPDTMLVLTNAIYFKGTWEYRFDKDSTIENGIFTLLDGSQVAVPMMRQTAHYGYAEGKGFKAVELPYVGDKLSMVILLPETGQFEEFSQGLNAERVNAILKGLRDQGFVAVHLPRFEYQSELNLAGPLLKMGMADVFTGAADFSGMDGTHSLFIDEVFHKALISVDEDGTEAAAGTAVTMRKSADHTVVADHPFIFLIRDIKTGTILFIGWVMDPS
jgi:serpin B